MATTRLIAMHRNRGRSIAQCLKARTDYAMHPEKTANGELVSAYACDPHTVDAEFCLSKKEYFEITGRERKDEVIAYQVRQSFKPGEVTPEEANRIGYELAERFLKGDYAFIVATHTDKQHIHNHLIWNSTALDCTHKFRNFLGSGRAIARLSDQICAEDQLSVITDPQQKGRAYNQWLGDRAKPSHRDNLRYAIDDAIQKKPAGFDELLRLLAGAGWEIKRGKQVSLRGPGEKRFKRLGTLGEAYSEENLEAVLAGTRKHTPQKRKASTSHTKVDLLVDIQAKPQAGKGPGYERWAKVFNLKQMAKTMVYLSEQGVSSYEALAQKAEDVSNRFTELREQYQATGSKMVANLDLKKHVIQYHKTREVYAGYRASGYSKKYLAAHEEAIRQHKEAKKAFDKLGLKKLPTVKSLQLEYESLAAQKKQEYAAYLQAKSERRELLTAKANVDRILAMSQEPEQ